MPVQDANSTELILESELYEVAESKRRVRDRFVIYQMPDGWFCLETTEAAGHWGKARIEISPNDLVALKDWIAELEHRL